LPPGVAMASFPRDEYCPMSRSLDADIGREPRPRLIAVALDDVAGLRDGRSSMASCASDERPGPAVFTAKEDDVGRWRRPVEVAGRSVVPKRDAAPGRERGGVSMTPSSSSCE